MSLMGGHIWIESEGLDKGCTVTFVVKLGIGNNQNEPSAQTGVPRGRTNHGSADLAGHRPVFRENSRVASPFPRYQRSL